MKTKKACQQVSSSWTHSYSWVKRAYGSASPLLYSFFAFFVFIFIFIFIVLYVAQQDYSPPTSSLSFQQDMTTFDPPLHQDYVQLLDDHDDHSTPPPSPPRTGTAFAVGKMEEKCKIYEGRWVWRKPMYEEEECMPYMHHQQACQKHGRPDKNYQFLRWQPNACDLPLFNGSMMLEALRGKRMVYVGDSLNRGQFGSMVCLLHTLVPDHQKSMEFLGSLTVLRLKEYNASVEFYWAPFLLESNSDDPVNHRLSSERIIRKGSIDKHGEFWKGADILVFNSYLWWTSGPYMKIILKGSFNDEEYKETEELSNEDAYRIAVQSMLTWVGDNMNPDTTRVFFTSMSPTHQRSREWGGEAGGNCYNETTMIEDAKYTGSNSIKSIMRVTSEELSKSNVPITFLNITQLSSYRKDAHVQIYKQSSLNASNNPNPEAYSDCVHWCLPGLQDVWNEFLFAQLFYPC